MTGRAGSGPRRASAGERALVEAWACFTKAVSIYPESSDRVKATLDAFAAALGAVAGEAGSVAVFVHAEHVQVGDAVVELYSGSTIDWLKQRFDRVALAGVRFCAPVPPASLLAFSRHLLLRCAQARAGERFEDLWPDRYPQLELIERRYAGAWLGGGAGRGAMAWPTEAPPGGELARLLEGEAGIVARLRGLRDAFDHAAARGGAGGAASPDATAVDLIGRIVDLLPAEAMVDRGAIVDRAERVLDELIEAVRAYDGAPVADAALSHLLFRISRKLFYRDAPAPGAAAAAPVAEPGAAGSPPAPTGHPGDEDIREDLPALLAEVAALPALESPDLVVAELELPEEQLAVYLHYLVREAEPRKRQARYPPLRALLAQPTPPALAVLRSYFASAPEMAGTDGAGRLLAFLREAELMALVRRCGIVTVPRVVESFPVGFALFLDSLDMRWPGDPELLDGVARTLGPERILAGAAHIQADGGLECHGRDAKVLGHPSADLLPLAHLLLAEGRGRRLPDVLRFARQLALPEREATPLRLLPDEALPLDYALCLTARLPGGRFPPRMHRLVSLLLTDFVCMTADQADELERRAYAISMLKAFPTAESQALLQRIVRGKGLLGLRREPSVVRQAAAAALRRDHGP